MVSVVEGVIVRPLPDVLLPVQNVVPRLTLFKVNGLLAGAPVALFQVTWTFRTVIESCGLVIVILIVLLPPVPGTVIQPAVILSHPGIGVEVAVGVKVSVGVSVFVGVNVIVGVEVIVGVSVGVLLGRGVNVITGPDGTVAVAVGVLDGTAVVGTAVVGTDGTVGAGVFRGADVGTELCPVVILRMPSMVRALFEMIGRESNGIRFTMGL
jgi:hypothetical protein